MQVHSIFHAIEGEGIRVGTPQIFVRFQGCSVGCTTCDTKESWDIHGGEAMSVAQILGTIKNMGCRRVVITGGNPLEQDATSLKLLVEALKMGDYWVGIELPGVVRTPKWLIDTVDFLSYDIKTPTCGYPADPEVILYNMMAAKPEKQQFKAVISSISDFWWLTAYVPMVNDQNIVLTPCWEPNKDMSTSWMPEVIEALVTNTSTWRIVGQQHKFFWGPTTQGV